MAYVGNHLYNCRAGLYDWSNTWAIVVSGSGPNFCGHAILQVSNDRFHIDGKNEYPWYLSPAGYQRYLRENRKRELRTDRIQIKDPQGAQRKLEELTARKWQWGIVVHNCATFVEEVVQAGGATNVGLYVNCPTAETFR